MNKTLLFAALILSVAYVAAKAEDPSFEQQAAAVQTAVAASAASTRAAIFVPQTPPPIPQLHRFHYDPYSGRCFNAYGQAGLNTVGLDELSWTKDGECADLRGASLNGSNFAYPKLVGWNLRGADLQGARLFFASLLDADLSGANLEGFLYGYAHITGTADRYTRGLDACRQGDAISCVR